MQKKKASKTAIEKALNLIEILKNNDDIGVTELSKILGLNKNNVFRLLATLEVEGLIEQDSKTGHYKLGMKTLYLENAYLKSLKFLEPAKSLMRQLRNKVNETIYLSILHKEDVIYIFSMESKSSVLVHSRVAKHYPAKNSAAGRSILRGKKESGFFIEKDFEETEKEVSEIATVIRDENGYPLSSISIVAPIFRLNEKNYKQFEQPLIETAKEISERLKTSHKTG